MTERNPIPPCLSHLEQMLPKRASNTAMHFLIKDLRGYARRLENGDTESICVVSDYAAEAMVRAADSLEASLPPKDGLASLARIESICREYEADGFYRPVQAIDEIRDILKLRGSEDNPPPSPGLVLGLTTAERQLLLTTSSWLTSLLMGQVSVGQSQGGLLPSDGAGILRTQIEAVRREREGG